jgi:hypothetical protein
VKLVKGKGRATRARALTRLASPRLASPGRAVGVGVGVAWRGVSCRVVSSRDRDRDRDRDAQFLSFMSVIHVSHNPLY